MCVYVCERKRERERERERERGEERGVSWEEVNLPNNVDTRSHLVVATLIGVWSISQQLRY